MNDPHNGWRALLPHYIEAYKSGNAKGSKPAGFKAKEKKDTIEYWYRRTPSHPGDKGGTTGNNPANGQTAMDPAFLSEDKVFLSVLVTEPSDISVQIGKSSPTKLRAKTAGISHFNVPFGDKLGSVTITVSRGGKDIVRAKGPEIIAQTSDGMVAWNAYAGSSSSLDGGKGN